MNFSDAIFLDTETTTAGRRKDTTPLEVIELAWAGIQSFEAPQPFGGQQRFLPKFPPQFGAIAVHHIFMSELKECQPSSEAPSHVPPASYWIGHNIDFDWKALGSPPVKRICTLALARALWPGLDSHTLSACVYYAFGTTAETRERLRNAHSASHDVDFVIDILEVLFQHPKLAKCQTAEDLWYISEWARVPTVWAFGKFEGLPISAADRGYAQWCRRQPDMDPYVIKALEREGLL